MKIERTKQPDEVEYEGENIELFFNGDNGVSLKVKSRWRKWTGMTVPEAKELSKVLPKFLEEMERETK